MNFPFPLFPSGIPLKLTPYDTAKNTPADLTKAIIGDGITLNGTPTFSGSASQAAFFVGGQNLGLAVTSGIVLTSGQAVMPLENTASNFGLGLSGAGNEQLDQMLAQSGVANFAGKTTNDAVSLTFNFTVTGGNAVKFNLLFGSDEYPEFADSFPDVAGVFVDGVNYGFFSGPSTPLSVLQSNIDAGYFKDNAESTIPLEYDGVSNGLMSIGLLNPALTVHTITIAVADTGDTILDSGMFINNLTVENATSGGVKQIIAATQGNDVITGGAGAEYAELDNGDDSMSAGGGDDIVKGNNGNDTVAGGDGFDQITGDAGADLLQGNLNGDTIQGGLGADTIQGGNGLDLLQGGNGFDNIVGALGGDTILGGAGGDTINGGGGADSLSGGAGTDRFVFDAASGADRITDFAPIDDTIAVGTGVSFSTPDEFYAALADDGLGNTVLDFGTGGNSITFVGVTAAQMSAADFVLF